ncbi:hypothetical protein QE152_g31416 [Popillia japonica]|uniref:Uncharacterized protein n=1 Tax=Popillia japonica TaxID=7064 RepID=A0AAW1J200_POPJA
MSCMISRTFKNPSPELMEIYKTYITPVMDYAAVVWNPYLAKDIHALEQTQRKISYNQNKPKEKYPTIKPLNYESRRKILHLTTFNDCWNKPKEKYPTIKPLNYESRRKILHLTTFNDCWKREDLIETYKILMGINNVDVFSC